MSLLNARDHEERPWGSFERFTLNEQSTVKVIRLNAGEQLSLQTHTGRSEFWYILAGAGTVTVDSDLRSVQAGDEVEIPVGVAHRATAGETPLAFLEIALGTFDEHDEVRLEDQYGRGSPGE